MFKTRTFSLIIAMVTFACTMSADVPSSPRSKAAVARVEPRLKDQLAKKGVSLGSPVFIRIFKEPAVLELWMQKGSQYELFRSYPICIFSGKLGPKLKEGDKQAPEGCYSVGAEQMNPNSSYHLSFNLGYPNEFDRYHKRTGSFLMVHGNCVSIGCFAMGDGPMEEIWTLCSKALEKGQKTFPVHCFPFPLTDANLKAHAKHQWIDFWEQLQSIYQQFEKTHVPPQVSIVKGQYQIAPERK